MSKNLDIVIEVKPQDMKYSVRNKKLESISEVMMIHSISQSKVTGLCLTIVIVIVVVVKNKTFATFTRLYVKSQMFAISDRYDHWL